MLVRVTVEMLLRTGLRVSEYTGLQADAVVLIGAGPWLHVPVGKLHEDRYLPLHPQLVTPIDAYRAAMSRPGTRCYCPGRTAGRWTAIPSPGSSIRPGQQPGWRTSTRTSSGTHLPPRPSTAE
jgi:integrase